MNDELPEMVCGLAGAIPVPDGGRPVMAGASSLSSVGQAEGMSDERDSS